MSKGLRQSQAFLHTWSGLLLGWLLFLIFVAGTIAFWREGLNRWMRPELGRIEQPMRVVAGAQAFLTRTVPDAKSWYITIPTARSAGAQLYWVPGADTPPASAAAAGEAVIGADGLPVRARDTRGGEFFYRFHFDLHYMPVIWARWLVGLAAMMMLVAIVSGIVTHKKIFRDFFTLRRGKGQRTWLDGHNASAVLALPFHLMMTYTGLVTLIAMLMPWAVVANYTDPAKIYDVLYPHPPAVAARTNRSAPLADLTRIAADAERRFGAPAGAIEVSDPGDAAARVTVSAGGVGSLTAYTPRLGYDGATGALLWQSPTPGAATKTTGVMVGLHAARFAGDGLRWLYFLGGIGGTLMVASGLVLWTVKRREKLPDPARPHAGFRLVERLNVAVIGGFPLGIAAMFVATRLLPVAMANRAEAEIGCLFAAWGAAGVGAIVARPARAWPAMFATTGTLLAALPVYNMVATARGLPATVPAGDWMLAGIDVAMAVFGAAFLWIARRIAQHRPAPKRPRASATRARVLEPAE